MAQLHNLGFPRIGAKRELKYALEDFWAGHSDEASLLATGKTLRATHWQHQKPLDWVSVGDFSFYDHVLDMSATLGVLPKRTVETGSPLDHYFRAARGRAKAHDCGQCAASQMTKWFDTNYHYLVPEFHSDTQFTVDATRLLSEYEEATALGFKAKPVIIGPVTYLALGKIKDNSSVLALLPKLIEAYKTLLASLRDAGVQWVQIDEPILTTELNAQWVNAFEQIYHQFKNIRINKLLTTYFGPLGNNLQWASQLPVEGFHLDAVSAPSEVIKLADWLPAHVVLSLGVVNGRNIWKSDLQKILQFLTPIYAKRQSLLWLAPSCSLLHVPVDLDQEQHLDPDIKSWLAFACQKLDELQLLKIVLEQGEDAANDALVENANALASRRNSARVHNAYVRQAVNDISIPDYHRKSSYSDRKIAQQDALNLPLLPTTTIGSFAQTPSIRKARNDYKKGIINEPHYLAQMHSEIAYCIQKQEALGIDVLVHGEPERNDMVEYFGELLNGFVITQFAWVQSYGSRCVKPPIIYGDVSRPKAMTVDFAKYAQSLSAKPVKGMLTGPVTILNWSFVRDDQPRKDTCLQIALAIRSEVQELEKNGIKIIQIDEPALREGLPLKQSQWQYYLSWAVDAFKLASSVVDDSTQIHTHMCYAEFNDILDAMTKLDADVITIETSRSDMELLKAFDAFSYPNDIGPGVYDIHTPNTPTMDNIIQLLEKAKESIPVARLWVNPDCGLKTRTWDEIIPALEEMVKAAQLLRKKYTT